MSALYNHGREAFLRGEIAWHTDAIMAQLIDTDSYTVNLASDEFLSDVPVGARIGSAVELTGKTTDSGIADASDLVFPAVPDDADAMILYVDNGAEVSSVLIAYIDSATGLPVSPGGMDVEVNWSSGVNKIFKL